MAKIVFFTDSLPKSNSRFAEMSWEIILNAAESGHDILVFTTRNDQLSVRHPRVEILQAFEKWNWREALQIIPILMQVRPELVHIVQPEAASLNSWLRSYKLILFICKTYLKSAQVLSVLNPHHSSLNWKSLAASRSFGLITVPPGYQPRIRNSDVTAETLRHTLRLQNLPILISATGRISGRTSGPTSGATSDQRTTDEILLGSGQTLLVLPGDIDQHDDIHLTLDRLMRARREYPNLKFVLAGGWGKTTSRQRFALQERIKELEIHITGPVTNDQLGQWIGASHAVWLLGMRAEFLGYFSGLNTALGIGKPILASPAQLEHVGYQDHPLFVLAQNQEIEISLTQLLDLVQQTRQMANEPVTPQGPHSSLLDGPKNKLNRLYAELLHKS